MKFQFFYPVDRESHSRYSKNTMHEYLRAQKIINLHGVGSAFHSGQCHVAIPAERLGRVLQYEKKKKNIESAILGNTLVVRALTCIYININIT